MISKRRRKQGKEFFFWGFLRKQCWYRRRADRQSRSRKGLKEYFPSRGRLIFYEGALFPCKLSHLGTLGSSDTWHRNWHIGGGDTLESFTFHDLSTKPYVIDRIHFVFRHFWKDIVLTTKGLPGDECWVKSWGHLNYCWTRPSENYISSLVVNLFLSVFSNQVVNQNFHKFLWKVLDPNFSCTNYQSIFGPGQSTVKAQSETELNFVFFSNISPNIWNSHSASLHSAQWHWHRPILVLGGLGAACVISLQYACNYYKHNYDTNTMQSWCQKYNRYWPPICHFFTVTVLNNVFKKLSLSLWMYEMSSYSQSSQVAVI